MSELITLTTGQAETIYGTFQGGKDYLAMMVGPQYDAWRALTTDDQRKMQLATAKRYLERFVWNATTAATFAVRDAIADGGGHPVFAYAEYELAALGAQDPSIFSTLETGSNIREAHAGSAGVTFFRPTSVSAGTSKPLPDVAYQLVGAYLASAAGGDLSFGQSGNCESAFEDSAEFEKVMPS